jgi:hypothetical protein
MARIKHSRTSKQQLGQFFTPTETAERLLASWELQSHWKVLEPGFGSGAFLLPLIASFLSLRGGDLAAVLTQNVWGVEIDETVYSETLAEIERRWGALPPRHNLILADYLDPAVLADEQVREADLLGDDRGFNLVIGNPPFGGTIALSLQDVLEKRYGRRHGCKIKRESYSLFIVKTLDLLKDGASLEFICSDTFLTIPTMRGLRNALMLEGRSEVRRLAQFSEETNYPMVVLRHTKDAPAETVLVDGCALGADNIRRTGNFSWKMLDDYTELFSGAFLTDYIVASSGMTTGRNEYFVRELDGHGGFDEPYEFEFVRDPISLQRELERARLGKISARKQVDIAALEHSGATRRNVRISQRDVPVKLAMPHADYRYYNKAQPGMFYAAPRYAIYWKDAGDAVITFKKNGSWYLHGVGGAPYFEREGLTWRLVSSRIDMRYLPPGYILDSGAPCAFLRPGIDKDELWFILGWCASPLATALMKSVLNHTMNIQSKDVERLPYPWWVGADEKQTAINAVRGIVDNLRRGKGPEPRSLDFLFGLYEFDRRSIPKVA